MAPKDAISINKCCIIKQTGLPHQQQERDTADSCKEDNLF